MPRATPASFTNWPITVDSPPASFWNVTSAEKAVSSSTRPHCTQQLRGGEGAGGRRRAWAAGGASGGGRWRPGGGACARRQAGAGHLREAIGVVHLHLRLAGAVVAVNHGCRREIGGAAGLRGGLELATDLQLAVGLRRARARAHRARERASCRPGGAWDAMHCLAANGHARDCGCKCLHAQRRQLARSSWLHWAVRSLGAPLAPRRADLNCATLPHLPQLLPTRPGAAPIGRALRLLLQRLQGIGSSSGGRHGAGGAVARRR